MAVFWWGNVGRPPTWPVTDQNVFIELCIYVFLNDNHAQSALSCIVPYTEEPIIDTILHPVMIMWYIDWQFFVCCIRRCVPNIDIFCGAVFFIPYERALGVHNK